MRNGLRSSRGAMRGTIGGTAGLATVAIGFRSFRVRALSATSLDCGRVPCVALVPLARQQPQTFGLAPGNSRSAVRDFLFVSRRVGQQIPIAALNRAKMNEFPTVTQRNRHDLGYVRPANWITYQAPRRPHGALPARNLRITLAPGFGGLDGAAHHPSPNL